MFDILSFSLFLQSYSAAAKASAEENIEAFRRALISNGDEAENAKEKVKSATLPGTRNRVKSAGPSRSNSSAIQTQDEFPDDNTDEVINTLAKSATVPDSRTRVRKRNRATNRKSGELEGSLD